MTQSLSRIRSEVGPLSYLLAPPLQAVDGNPSKKRMFMRKPAISTTVGSVEKKRKTSTESIVQHTTQLNTQGSVGQKPRVGKDIQGAVRMQRHTEIFTKEQVANASLSFTKQIFFSPRDTKKDYLAGSRYIQQSTQHSDAYDTDHTNDPCTQFQLNLKVNLDQTADLSSRTPPLEQSQQNDRISETIRNTQLEEKGRKNCQTVNYVQFQSRQDEGKCIYCKNSKKINEILQEKCSKLQEQLQHRSNSIRQLSERIEELKKQNGSLIAKTEQFEEIIYQKQMKVYQECALRFQTARKQFSRMSDRIKYLQIQNGMLLRYKDEFGLVTQEYEQIRFENESLKRQINVISRMGQQANKKKQAKPQTPYNMEKKPSTVGKYIYIKPMGEDDAISLQLSDRSFEQF